MAEEKKLNVLDDNLLEAIAGGALSEMDEHFFLAMIDEGKKNGRSIHDLLDAVDEVYCDRPELHNEICEFIVNNWGPS